MSNLKQLYVVLRLYSDDNQDVILPFYHVTGPPDIYRYWFARLIYLKYLPDVPAGKDTNPLGWCPSDRALIDRCLSQGLGLNVPNVDGVWYSLRGSTYGENPGLYPQTFAYWRGKEDRMIFVADARNETITYYLQTPPPDFPTMVWFRHDGRGNVLYLDGHIESHTSSTLTTNPGMGWQSSP